MNGGMDVGYPVAWIDTPAVSTFTSPGSSLMRIAKREQCRLMMNEV